MSDRFGIIDLHMHSTVSDGTDAPLALLEKVKAAGIGVFSVTDHDALTAGRILREACKPGDPVFIPGAEFSAKDAFGKYHILGYGFDPDGDPMQRLAAHGHSLRMQKVLARLERLRTEFGFTFPPEEIKALLALDNPGKPHIGNLMVQHGYAESRSTAIRDYIDKIRLQTERISPQEAIESILDGGGIPVLAHPFFGAGSDRLSCDEAEERLRRLKAYGLSGVEAFYSGFSDTQCAQMLSLADKYDLYVTAGSDYHGSNKPTKLGETGLNCAEIPKGLRRFLDVFAG